MNINFSGIKNQVVAGYQYAKDQAGILGNHMIRFLKPVLESIRQDGRLACVTVAAFNLLFLKVAIEIADLADRLFLRVLGPEKDWSQKGINTKSFILLTLVSSTIFLMNVVLHKGLRLPLSSSLTAAVSVGTLASYILFRLWIVTREGAQAK
jgi:hypothetical protein